MLIKDVKSLIWLCRWYNGRRARLQQLHDEHLGNLTNLILDDLGGVPTQPAELTLCGFTLQIVPAPCGLELVSISAPDLMSGEQLQLFSDDQLAAELFESQYSKEVKQNEAAA